MEKKKTITLTLIGLFIFLFGVIGLTYAFWSRTLTQEDKNLVYSDCLKLDVSWGEHGFTLTNAYPMTNDELVNDFFPSQEPYTFTITNSCNKEVPVSINMESLTAEDPELKDDYVDVILWEKKDTETNVFDPESNTVLSHQGSRNEIGSLEETPSYKLIDNKINSNKLITDAKEAYQLYKFKLGANATKSFNLLLFMDYDTPVDGTEVDGVPVQTNNAHWAGKITLNNYTPSTSIIRSRVDEESFWKYKSQITKVIFEDQLSPKEGATYSFDESEAQDESVISYLLVDKEAESCGYGNNTCYIAYIQGDGEVIANKDSSHFFKDFQHLKSIQGLEHLDTSQVENMNYMFSASTYDVWAGSLSDLTELDLSSLDTSHVTDMSYMFWGLRELNKLTLGDKFDTSNVTNMLAMFEESGLTKLDLGQSHFDTSQVSNMNRMFAWMPNLTELYLGDNFNASNVTDMDDIFGHMDTLQILDLGNNFNPIKITDMSEMFFNMETLQTLDLGDNFDTSQVTNMSNMFYNCRSLTSLNLGNAFDTSHVTDMSEMFYQLYELSSLDLGGKFDTSNVTDMSYMFGNDTGLKTITYGDNFVHNSEANITYMFGGNCPANRPTHDSWKNTEWYDGTEE